MGAPLQHEAAIIQRALSLVSEHFENAVILVSKHKQEHDQTQVTQWIARSTGNDLANVTVARMWCRTIEGRMQAAGSDDDG